MSRGITLQIDLPNGTPAYRQIVDGLRLLMVNGDLHPGDTLPTVRSLALDLGVHFSTVAEAYRTLRGEGWLQLRRHHGAFVTARRSPSPAPAAHAEFGTRLRQLIAPVRADSLSTSVISKELKLLARELSRGE
jgi:GntR family transcriptional regulator